MVRLYGPGPGSPPPLVSTADLAGLATSDVEGAPVGELVGALSEEATGLIRYLDISIRDAGKHVLVPIGHARIDRESVPPRVRLRAATHDDLLAIPEYVEEQTPVDAVYQEEVMEGHGQLFYGSRYYAHPAYDHSALHAGDAPIVGPVAPAEGAGLRPLSEVGPLRVAEGGPDLADWLVVDEDGENVGHVADFLLESASGRVRYIVLNLEFPERQAVLPIGYVAIDHGSDQVRVPALSVEDIRLLPPFEPPLTRAEENRLHAAIEGRLTGERYFQRPDFQRPPAPEFS